MMQSLLRCLVFSPLLAFSLFTLEASELHIGAATADITPPRPVALAGQMHVRISEEIETPLIVSSLALESREGEQVLDQAIIVTCDIVAIREGVLDEVREKAKDKLPGFDLKKLFLNATHTHAAPVTRIRPIELPEGDIMTPEEYRDLYTDRIAEAAVKSWEARQPGKMGYGQGQAVIGNNRRVVYADGSAVMHGNTNKPEFRSIEGREDHDVDILLFWDKKNKLIATVINLPCPAQVGGGQSAINADVWDPVRRELQKRYGEDLHVMPWIGAAGDVVPRLRIGMKAHERTLRLRGLTAMEEMTRRIVQGWEEAYEAAKLEPMEGVVLKHQVATIELPRRIPTEEEVAEAVEAAAKLKDDPKAQPRYNWYKRVVDLDKGIKDGSVKDFPMELHTLRLGDVAIGSNEFELFADYGAQLKARSPAIQTFLIQLAGPGGYLPTKRAVEGGGYSAIIQSNPVGPEGGQVLVDRTIASWEAMWEK